MENEYDVVVVGAGISGIGAGAHLNLKCPDQKYVILEGRESFGGTWDLFKYPGIRSDSDMHTLGYSFKPWTHKKSIANAPAIMDYLEETIDEYELHQHIRYKHHVETANWSSEESRWIVRVTDKVNNQEITFKAKLLYMCSGYYKYDHGYEPKFEGSENFEGQIVHPQKWSDNINYENKEVVVIGSGATAATIVPELAKKTKHTTMLQRSPTYFVSAPDEDYLANNLRRFIPDRLAYALIRIRNIFFQNFFFKRARAYPLKTKERILNMIKEELPEKIVDEHFTPSYNPWDQRICLIPNSDFFESIKAKTSSVVTDHIEKFEEKGIKLKSGKFLPADLIVTATGLILESFGGVKMSIDNKPIEASDTYTYRSLMYSGVPNLVSCFGYINASWTLKADLTSEYVCRLIKHMKKNDYEIVCPQFEVNMEESDDFLNGFSSGYLKRAAETQPRQGKEKPWVNLQDYFKDWIDIKFKKLDDGYLKFSKLDK